MQCSDSGTLRAYLDGELASSDQERVGRHVAECARCQEELNELRETVRSIASWLPVGNAEERAPAISLAQVRGRVTAARDRRRSSLGGAGGWFMSTNHRWITAAAAAVIVVSVAFSPISSAANDLLGVFRVQKFAAVTIDPSQLPMLPDFGKLGGMPQLPAAVPASAASHVKEVTLDQAAQAVDFPLKRAQSLPAQLGGQSRTFVTSAAEFSYTVNLANVEGQLAKAGMGDFKLPPSLDGATIKAQVPPTVISIYGAMAAAKTDTGAQAPTGPFLIIGQGRGPSLEVPESVDIESLRMEVLALPILPADIARQLKAIDDWRHTLIIPVRPGTHRDVTIAGAPGLLISHPDEGYTVLWQRDGVVFGLYGNLSESEMTRIATALR